MAIRDINQALEAVAEVASENKEKIKQNSNQRRSQVVDIYGQEFSRTGNMLKSATFYISISPDIIYLERFQFKLFVIDSDNAKNWSISIDGVDVTAFLREQADRMPNGKWMDGSEGIFPSTDLDVGNAISGSFDLIDVANTMYALGYRANAEKLLRAGFKRVTIKADDEFDVSLLLYLKYSHLNR